MKVSLNIGNNALKNVHLINQSIARQNGNANNKQASQTERKDGLTISPEGKKSSLLENLMKQKTSITEQKNSLIQSTLEKGGSLDTIKSQLETYDEQMKNIDAQIADMMAKEVEKQSEAKKQESGKPKTEQEVQNERLAGITSLASDLQRAQTVSSVQAKIEGGTQALKSEIELDKSRAGSSQGAKELIAKKEATLSAMEQKVSNLSSEIADSLSGITESISDLNAPLEAVPDSQTESGAAESDLTDKPSTDTNNGEGAKSL